MYSLYYSPGAASMVVHWLLIELGVPHELHLVDTATGAQKQPEYLALNPNGVVPTLLVAGEPMFEAAAMLLHLGDTHADAGLAPLSGDPQRRAYYQWMLHLANAVQPLFRIWWYPAEAGGEGNTDTVHALVRPRIEAAWERLDQHLDAHGPYLLGERASIADFYLTMLMRWSRNMPRPATDWSHLHALAQRMKARPSFKALYASERLSEWS